MKINLVSEESSLLFQATNERMQSILLSGNKESVSPMEGILMSAAGCSAIDIEIILKKMRQPLEKIEVEVEGIRADATPAVFTQIHLHYKLIGNIKEEKARQAVEMSLEKYCSVTHMLSKAVEIKHSYEVIRHK